MNLKPLILVIFLSSQAYTQAAVSEENCATMVGLLAMFKFKDMATSDHYNILRKIKPALSDEEMTKRRFEYPTSLCNDPKYQEVLSDLKDQKYVCETYDNKEKLIEEYLDSSSTSEVLDMEVGMEDSRCEDMRLKMKVNLRGSATSIGDSIDPTCETILGALENYMKGKKGEEVKCDKLTKEEKSET